MANIPSAPQGLSAKKSYIAKDYVTLREELFSKIPLITNGQWTNLNASDPGIALLEVFMSLVDNNLFYLDMQSQEMDIDKAKQRLNVIKLLRLIGYELKGVSASKGTVTLQVAPGENPFYPISILTGAQFTAQSSNGSVVFTALGGASLIGSTDVKTISVVQGLALSETFISDGTPNQKFTLSVNNIDKTTAVVYVDDDPTDDLPAIAWTLVDSFFSSTLDSSDFKVQVNENSQVSVIFGDGQFGKIPAKNSIITVTYIQTLGADGNVGKNAINRVSSGIPLIVDAKGNKVKLNVVNSEATAGGADVETIEQAKTTAKGLLFGLNRALSRGDFESLALSVPGVSKAIAWGENEEQNPDYRLLNRIRVSLFCKDFSDMFYNAASRASFRSLRDNQVRSLLTQKMPITTRLVFVDPVILDIFVSIAVGIDTSRYDPNIVLDQIRFNILDYFSIETISFGQDIRISILLALTNSVEGVSWARVTRLHTTPPNASPDPAPNPPVDLILDKWKIPTFSDTPILPVATVSTSSVLAPYLQFVTPASTNIGQNDITIINPDGQSDIIANGFTFFPGTNLQHITLNYSAITDEPNGGVFYGNPSPLYDIATYSSLE